MQDNGALPQSILNGTCYRFAHAIHITPRTSLAVNLLMTDHNQQLIVGDDSAIYYPNASLQLAAVRSSSGLREADTEIAGAFRVSGDPVATGPSYEEVAERIWDGAEVRIRLIDWRYPFAGNLSYRKLYVRMTSYSDEVWSFQLSGIISRLMPTKGRNYSRVCRHRLGDTQCGISLTTGDSYTGQTGTYVAKVTGATVTSIDSSRTGFRASGLTTTEDGWWRYGQVKWLTGDNTGTYQEVTGFTNIGRIFTLQVPTPEDIQVGDTFDVVTGCSKLWSMEGGCKEKFDNGVNFGGFPYIPEPDTVLKNAAGFKKDRD